MKKITRASATKTGSLKMKEAGGPSQETDGNTTESDDWRGKTLARVRALIKQAVPDVVEEVKWRKPSNGMRGVPVWSRGGILCTGETYKTAVKLTFARGAALEDPSGLFNASLEGNARRAIDLHERNEIDERAFKALIRAAAALNDESATSVAARRREAQRSRVGRTDRDA